MRGIEYLLRDKEVVSSHLTSKEALDAYIGTAWRSWENIRLFKSWIGISCLYQIKRTTEN